MTVRTAIQAALVFVALTISTDVAAQTECQTGTWAFYQALGSGGCTVGNLTFSDFKGSVLHKLGTVVSDAGNQITLTPLDFTSDGTGFLGFRLSAEPNILYTASDVVSDGFSGCDSVWCVYDESLRLGMDSNASISANSTDGSTLVGIGIGALQGTYAMPYYGAAGTSVVLSSRGNGSSLYVQRAGQNGNACWSDMGACRDVIASRISDSHLPEFGLMFNSRLMVEARPGQPVPSGGYNSFQSADILWAVAADGQSFDPWAGTGGSPPVGNITPEPASLLLLGTGLASVAMARRRRRVHRRQNTARTPAN